MPTTAQANGVAFDLGDTVPETAQVSVGAGEGARLIPCFVRAGQRYRRDVRLAFDTAYAVYQRKTREALAADDETIEMQAREGFLDAALAALMPDLTAEERAGIAQETATALFRKFEWLGPAPQDAEASETDPPPPAESSGAKNATPKPDSAP